MKPYIKNLLYIFGVYAVISLSVIIFNSDNAYALNITVNSTADVASADDGQCTLREAIDSANNDSHPHASVGECASGSGADSILFSISEPADYTISGQNGYTITPSAVLGAYYITSQVIIDGTSQPGASCTPRISLIELDGANIPLAIPYSMIALGPGSDNSEIRGITANNTNPNTIAMQTADGHTFRCNNFGMNPQGTAADGVPDQQTALYTLPGAGNEVDNLTIGGPNEDDTNYFGGYEHTCCGTINLQDSDNNTVQGNVFGLSFDGSTIIRNNLAIGIGGNLGGSSNNLIGGTASGEGNVILANSFGGGRTGISIAGLFEAPATTHESNNNRVYGNYIGVKEDGIVTPGYGSHVVGVVVLGSADNNKIGGTNSNQANVIAGNGEGVAILSTYEDDPTNNSILGNSIYDNGTLGITNGRGIAFIWDSVNDATLIPDSGLLAHIANDVGDPDVGPNAFLNSPEVTSAQQLGDELTLEFDLDAIGSPTDQYRIEFYVNDDADVNGFGEGQTYIGSTNTGTGTDLTATITLASANSLEGQVLSATTTVIDAAQYLGFGATSEFNKMTSGSIQYLGAGISNPADSETDAELAETGSPFFYYAVINIIAGSAISITAFVLLRKNRILYRYDHR